MGGGIVESSPLRRKRPASDEIVVEGKKMFLEDIVAYIYSRINEEPHGKLLHPRVFELKNRIERGRVSARDFRKHRNACRHRKMWISSPLAAQEFDEDDSQDIENCLRRDDSNVQECQQVKDNTR
ncbi:hypothetical protein PMAYCL1PPCAC_26622 [Pristionchus mayeri]|uniref:Uncharacterized protein n=1 Tax=Pristionchus mayeri TaxID=1317129 RepID=A0AAN5I8D5_9BILA|nr:hypothetical protein PMAYCL1PPCAC_26622 [Pristionchus mayeri]